MGVGSLVVLTFTITSAANREEYTTPHRTLGMDRAITWPEAPKLVCRAGPETIRRKLGSRHHPSIDGDHPIPTVHAVDRDGNEDAAVLRPRNPTAVEVRRRTVVNSQVELHPLLNHQGSVRTPYA